MFATWLTASGVVIVVVGTGGAIIGWRWFHHDRSDGLTRQYGVVKWLNIFHRRCVDDWNYATFLHVSLWQLLWLLLLMLRMLFLLFVR